MSKSAEGDEEEYFSTRDMRQWAQQEIKNATKELQLRVTEITNLVTAYAAGELTPEQAHEKHFLYRQRWGDALRGETMGDRVPDEQILERIDRA